MREQYLNLLYDSLDRLKEHVGEYHTLVDKVPIDLKRPGVFFYFDHKLKRQNGNTHRIIRVGRSGAPLKLLFVRGHNNGGGKHRRAIFREYVGKAIIHRDKLHHHFPTWGTPNEHESEHHLEVKTSEYIRPLPFLFISELNHQKRTLIESRSIELLSNKNQAIQIDVPHEDWLGHHLPGDVSASHLWNEEHVDNFQHDNEHRYIELIEVLNISIDQMKVA